MTFIARKRGYALGMNRDEKLTREKGQPPEVRSQNGVKVLCPSESNGGTWIAVNEFGASLSLINWYSVTNRVEHAPVSRGEVIKTLSACDSPDAVNSGLTTLPVARVNPFRLIGVFPAFGSIAEWRWDLEQLIRKTHPWKTQQWISSGFDEPTAQRMRGETFRRALRQSSSGSLGWLRRLHGSHGPNVGPFSTCMHRSDAATVSYTEVSVTSHLTVMRHCTRSLCQRPKLSQSHLSASKRTSEWSRPVAPRDPLTESLLPDKPLAHADFPHPKF
ncbi:MAG TPA: NRDE family protein [Verrucomicrobiae bacterium]|nr:NRDE family protein [Verrucomicrobiae bacterium]